MRLKLRLVLVMFCLCRAAISQNFTTRAFSTDQGLPDTYIYSVVQDKEGFLWISTGKGLVKFDGQVFQGYNLHANEQDDIIYSGTLDKNNELWFGTFSGKIYKLDRSKNRLKLYPKSIQGSVNKIIASQWGDRLYFFSKGTGIFMLEKNKLEQIPVSQNYQINSFEELDQNTLLVGTSEGLLTINIISDEAQQVGDLNFGIDQIQTLTKKKKGFLLSAAGKGILEVSIHENRSVNVRNVTEALSKNFPDGLSSFRFNEENSDLYFGTRTERFACMNLQTGKLRLIDESDFQGNINSIFIDKEFSIWATTTGKGLYRFFRTEFDLISLNNESVFSIVQDSSGNTYYGTRKGITVVDATGELKKEIVQIGNKELGKVNALYCDKHNKLWIGTENKGLVVADAVSLKLISLDFSSIENIAVNAITGKDRKSVV